MCNAVLNKFKDPNIPESINIENCQKCGGFWMNRGETTKYKRYQEFKQKILEQEKSDEFDEQIKKLLEQHSSNPSILINVGKVLSTRLDPYSLRPIGNLDKKETTADKIAILAVNILIIILQSLLHL